MTPNDYRRDCGLPDKYPMTAPNYSEQRKAVAKAAGLRRKRDAESQPPEAKRRPSIKVWNNVRFLPIADIHGGANLAA
jgi:hypothetical protein